jgi:hypothetical protein
VQHDTGPYTKGVCAPALEIGGVLDRVELVNCRSQLSHKGLHVPRGD